MTRRTAPTVEDKYGVAELELADGRVEMMPVKTVTSPIGKLPSGKVQYEKFQRFDFTGISRCARCGSQPDDRGLLTGSAGLLRIYLINGDGHWIQFVAACGGPDGPPYTGCLYGAWTHQRWKLPWADQYNIPRGMTDRQWTTLRMAAWTGDGYAEAAGRLRGDEAEVVDLLEKVRRWKESPNGV